MIRNLKALGLALVAVFAMSAVVASAASAQTNGKLTSDGPVTLVGTQTGPELENSLTAFGTAEAKDKVVCLKATYTGHQTQTIAHTEQTIKEGKQLKHEPLPSGSSTVTITPHYVECFHRPTNLPVTVDMNGCDYEFHLRETTPAPAVHTYKVTTTVECPKEKHIQVTIFTGASHAIRACSVTITQKTDYEGIEAIDTTNGTIDITGTISGIEGHREGFGCTKETEKAGVLHIDVNVKGKHPTTGVATPISISH